MRLLFSLVVLQSLWHRLSSGHIKDILFPPHAFHQNNGNFRLRYTHLLQQTSRSPMTLDRTVIKDLTKLSDLDASSTATVDNPIQSLQDMIPTGSFNTNTNFIVGPFFAQQGILGLVQYPLYLSLLSSNLRDFGQSANFPILLQESLIPLYSGSGGYLKGKIPSLDESSLINMRFGQLEIEKIIASNTFSGINFFNNIFRKFSMGQHLVAYKLMYLSLDNTALLSANGPLNLAQSNVSPESKDEKIIVLPNRPSQQMNLEAVTGKSEIQNEPADQGGAAESRQSILNQSIIDALKQTKAEKRSVSSEEYPANTPIQNRNNQGISNGEPNMSSSQNNPAATLTISSSGSTTHSQEYTTFGIFHDKVRNMVDQSKKNFEDYSDEDPNKASDAWQKVVDHYFDMKASSYDYGNRSVTYSNPTEMSEDDFKHAVLLAIPRDIANQLDFKLNANCSDVKVLLRFAQAVGKVNDTCNDDNQKLKLDIDSMKKTSDYKIAEKGFNEHNSGLEFDETLTNLASGNTISNKAIQELLGSASEQNDLPAASSRISISP
ncbi:hypothetical protein N9Y17_01250 [Gammaproteobacteria bacterium]|nr:hypothetical protein [Gammaproteobacteria bacterium]